MEADSSDIMQFMRLNAASPGNAKGLIPPRIPQKVETQFRKDTFKRYDNLVIIFAIPSVEIV